MNVKKFGISNFYSLTHCILLKHRVVEMFEIGRDIALVDDVHIPNGLFSTVYQDRPYRINTKSVTRRKIDTNFSLGTLFNHGAP